MTIIHEFDIREQAIDHVTILSDRAEVKRFVKILSKKGMNEIQLKNFSVCLHRDSVRVEGRGEATICDVTEKQVPASYADTDSPKVAELREKLNIHDAARLKLEDQRDVLKKQIEGLDRTVGEIGKGVVNPGKDAGTVIIDEKLLEGLQKLFDFHGTESESLKQRLREKELEIMKEIELGGKISDELNANINASRSQSSHHVVISLEARTDGEVELEVTYQVFRAGWEPSYDIRVDTQEPSMTVSYYGKIYNHSGEDWNDFSAVLSTAQPCLGGNIPRLGTLDAQLFKPVQVFRKKSVIPFRNMYLRSRGGRDDVEEESAESESLEMEMGVPEVEVSQNTLSTEFKIARRATVPHGTSDHRVTIGSPVLTPSLVHESVPSKNSAAFLTASAVNSSVFPFLSGETSIFLDNAFVAKSHLKNVSPGERFTCSLGVDTAIRVEYKAAKKYHEEGGYITKHSADVTEQSIHLKNTRSEQPVLLTLKHHVPRSTDEKIRVKLITPIATPYDPEKANGNEVVAPKEGVLLNKENNLEWTVKLPPNTTKDLVVKWVVEHPKGQPIEFQEKL